MVRRFRQKRNITKPLTVALGNTQGPMTGLTCSSLHAAWHPPTGSCHFVFVPFSSFSVSLLLFCSLVPSLVRLLTRVNLVFNLLLLFSLLLLLLLLFLFPPAFFHSLGSFLLYFYFKKEKSRIFQAVQLSSFNFSISFEYQFAQLCPLLPLTFFFHSHNFRSLSFLNIFYSPSLRFIHSPPFLRISSLVSTIRPPPLHSIRVSYFKLRKVGRVKGILYRLRFQAALFALLFVNLSACLELGVHSHTFTWVIIPNRIFPYCTQSQSVIFASS